MSPNSSRPSRTILHVRKPRASASTRYSRRCIKARRVTRTRRSWERAREAGMTGLLLLALLAAVPSATAADDPLPSWNDGPAKAKIIAFVEGVTTVDGKD